MSCYIVEPSPLTYNEFGFDAKLINKKVNRFGPLFMKLKDKNCPEQIYYEFNTKTMPSIDFPFTDSSILIVSEKVKEILCNKDCDNNIKWVPARMVKKGNNFNNFSYTYYAPIFLKYSELFDFDNSIYKEDTLFGKKVGTIMDMVLKEPLGGFPEMFKLDEAIRFIFINEQVKKELENSNTKGCSFEEVKVTPYSK